MTVSGLARPGTGRKISCWCSAAVPELTAPPYRFASRSCICTGPCTCRPMTRSRKPGHAVPSAPPSAVRRRRPPASVHVPASPPSLSRGRCGTCVYAQADSVPAGDLLRSVVLSWPTSRKGTSGTRLVARSAAYRVISSRVSATCTVPARRAGSAVHGIGALSAQSTFTVAWSHSNRVRSARSCGGSDSAASNSR
jgi:hypothetical protein